MSEARRVQILMATYNGSRYVRAQLESLRRQDCADQIALLVRDDGSTDDTLAIAEAFDRGPLAMSVIAGANLGVKGCFKALMEAADRRADYFLFCDQDDVWAKGKVSAAVASMPDPTCPALYCSRSIITDSALRPLGLTADVPRGPSFRNALIQNIAPGHTMAFTRPLLDLAWLSFDTDRAIMHDHWLYLLGTAFGSVFFDRRPWTRYRTHVDNQIGYESDPMSHLIGRARRVFTLDRGIYTRQVRAFVESVGDQLSPTDCAAAEALLDQASLIQRWQAIQQYPLIHQSRLAQWAATILFLIGRYRG